MGKKAQKAICIFGAAYLLEQVDQMDKEIAGALTNNDIEFVHRARVASRRLRNGLNLFEDCLPTKKFTDWQDGVRRVTKALGRARDLDIQIECINQIYNEDLDEKLKPGYRRLLLRLKQQRAKAQNKVTQTFDQHQEDNILKTLHSQLETMTFGMENIYLFTPSLYKRAFTAINQRLDDFLGFQEFVEKPDNIEKLHAMRIAGKHLRYTMEIFAPIYKQALLPYVQVMKELQDQLGIIHDNDVWVTWLPKFITKEEQRIEDYFGNVGPLKRLMPGFNHLIEDRQKARDNEYRAFLSLWKTLQQENAWKSLKEIIKTPINVESALSHMANEPGPSYKPAKEDLEKSSDKLAFDTPQDPGAIPPDLGDISPLGSEQYEENDL